MLDSGLETIDVAVQTSLSSLNGSTRSEVEEELSKLREDKSLLEGKIRGYLTLSDICQEYKDELGRLKAEYQKLLAKVNQQEMKSELQHLSHASPTPENDLGNDDRHDIEQRNNQTDETTNDENTEKRDVNLNQIQNTEKYDVHMTQTEANDVNINHKENHIRTSELFDPGPDLSKSSEGIKVIPESMSNKSENEKAGADNNHSFGTKLDKYPMQESMAMSSQESLTGLGFEHVSDHMNLGESAGTLRRDLMVFASINHQTDDKTAKKKQEVTELNEVIISLPIDSDESKRVLETVSKVLDKKDQLNKKLTHMNEVLIEKNSQLQRDKKELDKDRQRILNKVQTLEKQIYDISASRSRSPEEGWVKVDKVTENEVQKASVENITRPKNSLEQLQEQNKQLRDANQKWSQEWDKLRKHFETRISELQTERDRIAKEITELKIREDAKERDYEKMIMNAKKKAGEEESAKEEALLQLTAANNRLDAQNSQLVELQDEVTRMRRQKQSIETELNVMRQQGPSRGPDRAVEAPLGTSPPDRNATDLKNENMVLRHQILVFQEDFDKERQDRATAQSLKDELKKQNESLKKRSRQLEMKNSTLERQLKASEDGSRKALQDRDRLLQELSDVKNQLQRERENNTRYQSPYQPPIIQSAGFYQTQPQPQRLPQSQSPPQPQQMFGQLIMPQQHHPVVVPPGTHYQHRPSGYDRNAGVYNTAPPPQVQTRSPPIYPTNQTGQETEMLAGSWSCSQCTYKNYPGRTVCEMCGYIQSPPPNPPVIRHGTGPLVPRGDEQQQHGYYGYNVGGARQPDGRTGT